MPLPLLLIGPLIEAAKTVIDRVIPDKAAAEKAKQELSPPSPRRYSSSPRLRSR
jgi:hypothetical protein